MLRGGGLAVRELRAAATQLHVDEATAALVVETAAAAGLLAERADTDGNPVWVPTDGFDVWSGRDLAERWLTLVRGWLESPRMPALVGTRDSNGKTRNALAPDLAGPTMVETRAMTLERLAALPPGEVLAAGHRRPVAGGQGRVAAAPATPDPRRPGRLDGHRGRVRSA